MEYHGCLIKTLGEPLCKVFQAGFLTHSVPRLDQNDPSVLAKTLGILICFPAYETVGVVLKQTVQKDDIDTQAQPTPGQADSANHII